MNISVYKPTEPGYYWMRSTGVWLLVLIAENYSHRRKTIPLMVIGVSPSCQGWKQPLSELEDGKHLWSDRIQEPTSET